MSEWETAVTWLLIIVTALALVSTRRDVARLHDRMSDIEAALDIADRQKR